MKKKELEQKPQAEIQEVSYETSPQEEHANVLFKPNEGPQTTFLAASEREVLYGGSVNPKNINELKLIKNIDGFLIGGASQNAKKFIDIIKKTYN